jgi:hypothetical protein
LTDINRHIRNCVLQDITNWPPSAAPSQNGLTDRVRVPCPVNAMARTAISAWLIGACRTVHSPLTTTKPASPNGLTGSESPSDLTPHLRPPHARRAGAGVSPGENWQGGGCRNVRRRLISSKPQPRQICPSATPTRQPLHLGARHPPVVAQLHRLDAPRSAPVRDRAPRASRCSWSKVRGGRSLVMVIR